MKKLVLGALLALISSSSLASPSTGTMICRASDYAFVELQDIPSSGTSIFYGVFYKGKYIAKKHDTIYSFQRSYLNTWSGDFNVSDLKSDSFLVVKIGGETRTKRCT